MPEELTPEQLRRTCDPNRFGIGTTTEVTAPSEILGQPRATAALQFGLGMASGGYHIYIAGPPGTGKMTAVKAFLAEAALSRPPADDLCYTYNFSDPERPRALRLPPGRGRQLARDLDQLVAIVRRQLPRAFESDDYINQRAMIVGALEQERENQLEQLASRARAAGFALQASSLGLLIVALREGKPIPDEEFEALRPEDRAALQEKRVALEGDVARVMKGIRERESTAREGLARLDRDVALHTVGGLLADLAERYAAFPAVVEYLGGVREDMVAQLDLFRTPSNDQPAQEASVRLQREQAFRRYRINVVIDRDQANGAPVVMEANPTFSNLVGRIDKEAQFGMLVTDFTLIRGGALHRANGGYLVVRAEDILRQSLAWDALKRALRNREIVIEEPTDALGISAVRTLRPDPVALDLKVVLVGEASLYYALHEHDPDFPELFRVRSDFDPRMPRSPDNEEALFRFVCTFCREERIRPLDGGALARLVEHASRLAEDQDKLSAQFGLIADLIREASYWATRAGAATVTAEHVVQALEQQIYRSSLVEDTLREMVARGTLLVDTSGAIVGQVNGLSVQSVADHSFGLPSRITAAVGIGRDGVVDIERQANLGGSLHTKGVLILAGFLTDRFAQAQPLALSARLAFEQSYGVVDGDSASSAEVYALLSRLADVPIRQGLAVTGSVNQRGEIQAIGAVNQKIEGFFAVCRERGLTGGQGVLIPAANVANLMLRDEVVDAVHAGTFHVYPIRTIDEGIALLTGVPAGERQDDGRYSAGTINGRVEARLREMARALRWSTSGPEENGKVGDTAGTELIF